MIARVGLQGGERPCCVKMLRHREQFEAEIRARFVNGRALHSDVVVALWGWHTCVSEPLFTIDDSATGACITPEPQRLSSTEAEEYPFCIVMERGERSLHDACSKERIAGVDSRAIVLAMRQVLQCLASLHAVGVVHGDVKQRNILRNASGAWMLCDMDAAARVGTPIGAKTSTAYMPPELARCRYADGAAGHLERAESSFDVFSVGVVLFELCSGPVKYALDPLSCTASPAFWRPRMR